METKWENGKLYKINTEKHFDDRNTKVFIDITNTLTLPELDQAVSNNNLTVYQALNLAYMLGKRIEK